MKIPRGWEAPPDPSRGYAGEGLIIAEDYPWLTKQLFAIYEVVRDGGWWTLSAISELTGIGETSVQAQLQNMRMERFGSYEVLRRPAADPSGGRKFEYRVGLKGSGTPRRHTCKRAQAAERLGDELADALEKYAPDHPLLAAWDELG